MRTNPGAIIAALLCAAISSSTLASPPGISNAVTYGMGVDSCGKWLANHDPKNPSDLLRNAVEHQWLLGWVSAAGYYGEALPRPLRLRRADGPALFAWVDNYCHQHPLDPLAFAAARLVAALAKTN